MKYNLCKRHSKIWSVMSKRVLKWIEKRVNLSKKKYKYAWDMRNKIWVCLMAS